MSGYDDFCKDETTETERTERSDHLKAKANNIVNKFADLMLPEKARLNELEFLIERALRSVQEEAVKEYAVRAEEFNMDFEKSLKEMSYKQGFAEGIEKAAQISDTEEELDGPIPQRNLEAILANPELSLRAAVRSTKKNISRRIRALKQSVLSNSEDSKGDK